MPIPGYPKQVCCSVCSWKFSLVQTGDCVLMPFDACPKCGAELRIVPASQWEIVKSRLRRILR